MTTFAPITREKVDADWIDVRRKLIARSGYSVRAGEGNTIELKSLTPIEHLASHDRLRLNQWIAIALPNEATCFATAADRDAVLSQLLQLSS